MLISELKKSIEDKSIINSRVIVAELPKSKNTFIIHQYLHQIVLDNNLSISLIDDISVINDPFNSFKDALWVNYVDKFVGNVEDIFLRIPSNCFLIIVANVVENEIKSLYNKYVVEIPELENSQIRAYAYSNLEGIDKKRIDWLLDICKYDIYKLDQEIDRLKIFPIGDRNYTFQQCVEGGIYDNLSLYNIFNFTNALITKDINKLKIILSEIENCDVEPTGLITILNNNFRNIISIQLDPTATAESLNMNAKQFSAIRYSCGRYTKEQLISAYKLISLLDFNLKTGKLPAACIADYVVTHLLSL